MMHDAALARGRALHNFELEKLGGHVRDRLPRFAGFGAHAAADWHLQVELAWWVNYVSATPAKNGGVGGWVGG